MIVTTSIHRNGRVVEVTAYDTEKEEYIAVSMPDEEFWKALVEYVERNAPPAIVIGKDDG